MLRSLREAEEVELQVCRCSDELQVQQIVQQFGDGLGKRPEEPEMMVRFQKELNFFIYFGTVY